MPAIPTSISLCCLYVPNDEKLGEDLLKHLETLHQQIGFVLWRPFVGESMMQFTSRVITKTSIILLVISADFLISDFYANVMAALQANIAHVVPILGRPSNWKG